MLATVAADRACPAAVAELDVRHHPHVMKSHTLIFLVVAAALVGSCSKRGEPVAIEPGVAVGSVHSGMTTQQVIAELGQPDPTNYFFDTNYYGGPALEYSHLGLIVAPDKGGVVNRVTITHPFAGRSKDGIGIGSSRAEVIRAYGAPTITRPGTAGYEFLRYGKLGLIFQLHDGKVDMMSVFFPARHVQGP